MFDSNVEAGEIYLYDDLGPEWAGMIDDGQVASALNSMRGQDIDVRINSGGGDVFIGASIHNALARHDGEITAYVDGLSASAMTYAMLGANKVVAAENAVFMMHKPWTMAMGNEDDLAKSIEALQTVESAMLGMYERQTGRTSSEIRSVLREEKWMTAEQALEFGLVDDIEGPVEIEDQSPTMAAKHPRLVAIYQDCQVFRDSGGVQPKFVSQARREKLRIRNATRLQMR